MQTDSLTGLPGGGAVHATLQRTLQDRDAAALTLLDVDRFAELNDTLGSDAGDSLLRGLAGLLNDEVGTTPGASAFRVSGDAFALLLPDVSLEQAFLRMERVRARIEAANLASLGGAPVTVSIGVAQYPRDGKDAAGLHKAAEAALMAAKEQGRNTVALPPNEEMVMKSCYYPSTAVRQLRLLAERLGRKESVLLREALTDVLRKYDTQRQVA
jgi:diguanylate cyclase (GGDEF)-like protein